MKPTYEDLKNRFTYHPPPDKARIEAHAKVSSLCLDTARALVLICPEGRNLSLCLTALEDARMRANAALACDSPPGSDGHIACWHGTCEKNVVTGTDYCEDHGMSPPHA